ncbi:T9SS type A sorting domain-containing protein [Flavobacterium sp. KMS]|uniref:T9SS type A sorting domain-containing protein n=1 Tax=Flavobacterium sp. KMS TaxID=1566023 RepID=UPI00103B7645|nr:T9SS type A sorting domain-containing protein [Flavobacterium sp. KMS]
MKKYYLLLLFFVSLLGYSQQKTGVGELSGGARTVPIDNPKAILITGSSTDATAKGLNNGTIILNPPAGGITNGNGPYTYSWTKDNKAFVTDVTSFNNLYAGYYIVAITENGKCTVYKDFRIGEPDKELVATISGNIDIVCNGGTTTLTANPSGGFPNTNAIYTYSWDIAYEDGTSTSSTGNVVTGKAGLYTLTVYDNAKPVNKFVISQKVSQRDILTVNPTTSIIKHVLCKNELTGEIDLNISGGTGPYNVVWEDNNATGSKRTGLKAGDYYYKITDSQGCIFSKYSTLVTIKEPTVKLSTNTASQKQPSTSTSNDGEITINAIGGENGYTYIVTKVNGTTTTYSTNIITGLGDGIYDIYVKDGNGCTTTSERFTLKALAINLVKQVDIKCFGEKTGALTIEAVGGTTPYTYSWFNIVEGVETVIPLQTNSSLTGLVTGKYRIKLKDKFKEIYTDYNITQPLNPLEATHSYTDVSCYGGNNGTITLDIKGGTAGYTVVYTDIKNPAKTIDATKLIAGTYSYIITDANNCTYNSPANITISQNAQVAITSITQTQPTIVTANDGVITINADGGTKKYTYILKKNGTSTEYTTNVITGLGDGVYDVTVRDGNNCTSSSETVTLKALAIAFVNKIDVTCNGANTGSIEVLVSGGKPQYSYKWYYKQNATDINYTELAGEITNRAQNLYAGFYKVVVTDNVNISRELIIAELIERPAITCTFVKTNVSCFNGSDATITLTIQGGTGDYHVTWNDGVTTKDRTGIPFGDYSFTITDDNGCSYSTTPVAVKITQPLKPLIIASYNKIEASGYSLKNGSIDIVAADGTAPYTYQWYQGAGKTVMAGKKNALLNGIGEGTYTVVVTDKNLCTTEATYTIYQPDELLITNISQTQAIKCFENKQAILKATITGGAPIGVPDADKNYIYKWYNKLTPAVVASTTNPSETLLAGDYILEVSDGFGNSFTSTPVTVIQPDLLKINYTQKNVSCNGGSDAAITIAITGGTGPYKIVWSTGNNANKNTLDNLIASTYNVTVTDANLCETKQEIIITEPKAMGIIVVKTPPSAFGVDDASIKVTVVGGTPNYNFKWYDKNDTLIYTDDNKESNSIYNIYVGQYFITITDANGCLIEKRDLDKVDPLFIKLAQINIVKCHGDATASIKAITSGGLPDYYYKWYDVTNPNLVISEAETLINAKVGTYYVIATDYFGKSIQSENITITEPSALDNSLSSQYTRCGDGNDWTITSAASGGTAPYSYLWNTGVRTPDLVNTPPGNYSLLVTDNNGCTIIKNINIVAPIHLAAAEVIKIPTCYAGGDATITVTASGGKAPYYYLWNTGEKSNVLSNVSAGNYTITVTDSKGCIIDHTYTIVNPPKDIINLGEDVTLCFDQSLTINATIDDDKATYAWTSDKGFTSNKPMITVSQPANYTVVVTNKLGCEASDTIKISAQQTAISAEFAISSQVFVNEKFIIVDISNPEADSIEWILPADATVKSKDKDYAEMSFSKAGEYEITMVTQKGDCTAFQTKKVLVIEGEYKDPETTDLQKKFDIKIYPNPSNGIFTVDVTLDKIMAGHVKVYNLSNNMVIDSKSENGKDAYSFNFSLSGLPSGIYFVLFESQQGNKLRKIIIQ